jgi:glycosyltransferase involved in cell wall biosynthesis
MRRATLALLVPAYNAAKFLPRLLSSAQGQARPFDEIWVYDDCSSDDTSSVALSYGAKVVRGDVNKGCTAGKSILVEQTSCDWIHFHDADDVLLPDFVSASEKWMAEDACEVVVFSCEERWDHSNELISLSSPDDGRLRSDPIRYTISDKINAISGLYRRSAFLAAGGFDLDANVLFNEDQALHCHLARAGLKFRGDKTIASLNFRQHASMSNSNQAKCVRAHYHVMLKALAHPSGEANRDVIAERLWHVVAGAAAYMDWQTADAAAALAMKIAGTSAGPSGKLFKSLCKISAPAAIRLREGLIRSLKPRYRAGYPGWRSPISVL